VFRTEVIDEADQEDEADGGHPDVIPGDAKIAHSVPATHRRRDDKVGQQQKGPQHRQDAALLPRRRINPAAIGVMLADDDVVIADQACQRANRNNDGKRGETSGDECQADDIGFARSPVAVQ